MKPKPISSIKVASSSAVSSSFAPSASSTSAEPLRPVAVRLPCLATAQPAAAAIRAAVVEMLKVRRPPPVPQVSSRWWCCGLTLVARERIVSASPASSSTVSPFSRSPNSSAVICESLASPAMITASAAAAWSCVRSCFAATASFANSSADSAISGPPR